jgi:putative redox protein
MANVTATVSLDEGLQAKIDVRQFEFVADEPVEDGGLDSGPKPTEILLSSVGACAVITMKLYAQRKGWDLQKVQVTLELEKVDPALYPDTLTPTGILHVIRKHYTIEGNLDAEQKTRLMEIGGKCPVARVVANPVIYEDMLVS